MNSHPVIGGFGSRPEERGAAPVIDLAAWVKAAATPATPLHEPEDCPISAIVRDWMTALEETGGDALLAHLYATAELLDAICEAKNVRNAAYGTSLTLYEEIAKMARERRGARRP